MRVSRVSIRDALSNFPWLHRSISGWEKESYLFWASHLPYSRDHAPPKEGTQTFRSKFFEEKWSLIRDNVSPTGERLREMVYRVGQKILAGLKLQVFYLSTLF